MFRHLLVTCVIFASVYCSMLFAIDHPIVAQAASSEAKPTTSNTPIVVHTETVIKEANPAKTRKSAQNRIDFHGPNIVGLSQQVLLNDQGQDVAKAWQTLFENQALVNAINWSKAPIHAYAFYHSFSKDMSVATLHLGVETKYFKTPDTGLAKTLPRGSAETFLIDPKTGVASDQAWRQAFLKGHLIEHHIIHANGETLTAKAFIVE